MKASNALLRIARAVLQNVMDTINKQINRLATEVIAPIEETVKLVDSEDVWQGKGANRFADNVRTDLLPRVHRIAENLNNLNKNITIAQDILDQADSEASAGVSDLIDTFDRI